MPGPATGSGRDHTPPPAHQSGFTPRQLRPDEQEQLLDYGLGVTNVVARASARADELTSDELRAGAARLTKLAAKFRPGYVAVVGISAYRTAFDRPQATIGEQNDPIAGSRLWVLPNPSGLNAHYQLPALVAEFLALKEKAVGLAQTPSARDKTHDPRPRNGGPD